MVSPIFSRLFFTAIECQVNQVDVQEPEFPEKPNSPLNNVSVSVYKFSPPSPSLLGIISQ